MIGRASFSPESPPVYRYSLERRWGRSDPRSTVLFIMLNPSTADAEQLDPTVTRCVGFAKAWGYTRLLVGNACALRSTDPSALRTDPDPVGNPENDEAIRAMCLRSSLVVVAWGVHLSDTRAQAVLNVIREAKREPHALWVTKKGAPSHPLYLPGNLRPEPYSC